MPAGSVAAKSPYGWYKLWSARLCLKSSFFSVAFIDIGAPKRPCFAQDDGKLRWVLSMSTTEVVQRTEGPIGIDIIDASINQLVWEGAATGRVTDSVRQNIEQVARDAVADIFLQFP